MCLSVMKQGCASHSWQLEKRLIAGCDAFLELANTVNGNGEESEYEQVRNGSPGHRRRETASQVSQQSRAMIFLQNVIVLSMCPHLTPGRGGPPRTNYDTFRVA